MSNQKVKLSEVLGKTNPDRPKKLDTKKTRLELVAPFSIGIEFELENLKGNFNKQGLLQDFWQEVGDGSLRGDGREFITRIPIKEDDVIIALENIYEAAKGSMEVLSSLRTSAHIHVNALDMDTEELALFLAAGALSEEYILSLNDEYRKFCGYCVDSNLAVAHVIANMFKTKGFRADLNSRYYGVNPLSINKHGTVEFRHFSVPYTIEDAVRNINICLHLKKLAVEIASTLPGPLTRKNIEEPLTRMRADLETIFNTKLIKPLDPLLTAIDMEMVRDERWTNAPRVLAAGEEPDRPEQVEENNQNERLTTFRGVDLFTTGHWDTAEIETRVAGTARVEETGTRFVGGEGVAELQRRLNERALAMGVRQIPEWLQPTAPIPENNRPTQNTRTEARMVNGRIIHFTIAQGTLGTSITAREAGSTRVIGTDFIGTARATPPNVLGRVENIAARLEQTLTPQPPPIGF